MAQKILERLNLLRDGAIEMNFERLLISAEPGVNTVELS